MSLNLNLEKNLVNIAECLETDAKELDFILPGFVAGTVACLAAAGSTGKSYATMEIAIGICSNDADKKLLNMGIHKEGKVAIFNAEDPHDVIHARLRSMSVHLDQKMREKMAANLKIYSITGMQPDIMNPDWQNEIIRIGTGKRLLAIETFSRFHRLDENSNGQMSQVIGVLEMIAKVTGAAVLFVHHTAKSAALNGDQDKQQSSRGASTIVDNCRWQGYMQTMSEDEAKKLSVPLDDRKMYVQIGGNKENYGSPTIAKWLKRGEGGVLLPANIKSLNKPDIKLVASDKPSKKEVKNESNY